MCQATVKSMNITSTEFEMQCAWSDFNAAFVGTSDETSGTVKKLIDFFPAAFPHRGFNTKTVFNDKAKALAVERKEEAKMEIAVDEVLTTERQEKQEKCRSLGKRKPSAGSLRTPLKVAKE